LTSRCIMCTGRVLATNLLVDLKLVLIRSSIMIKDIEMMTSDAAVTDNHKLKQSKEGREDRNYNIQYIAALRSLSL
jgi:hypothetical protein